LLPASHAAIAVVHDAVDSKGLGQVLEPRQRRHGRELLIKVLVVAVLVFVLLLLVLLYVVIVLENVTPFVVKDTKHAPVTLGPLRLMLGPLLASRAAICAGLRLLLPVRRRSPVDDAVDREPLHEAINCRLAVGMGQFDFLVLVAGHGAAVAAN
jgi:hypothetical protein